MVGTARDRSSQAQCQVAAKAKQNVGVTHRPRLCYSTVDPLRFVTLSSKQSQKRLCGQSSNTAITEVARQHSQAVTAQLHHQNRSSRPDILTHHKLRAASRVHIRASTVQYLPTLCSKLNIVAVQAVLYISRNHWQEQRIRLYVGPSLLS